MYILVTDIFHRKAFDVIAILTDRFPDIQLILGCDDLSSMARLNKKLLYKGHLELLRTQEYDLFKSDLAEIAKKYKKDQVVYVPLEEETTRFFIESLQNLHLQNFIYLLPSLSVFDTLRNKQALNKYCEKNNIDCPRLYDVAHIQELTKDAYPLLLKPCVGSGSQGLMRLMEPEHLTQEIMKTISTQDYLLQELLPNGKDVKGAFFLCKEGHVVSTYTHERIRTSPPTGGVTVLSTMGMNDQIISTGTALLEKIRWNGLIMLEFLYDERDDKYKIIEANPRLWGSIMLSEYSGANLLTNYIQLCLGRTPKLGPVNMEARIRWFFPVDVLNYLKSFGRITDFWSFKNTCLINKTYASFFSSFWFNAISIMNMKNIKRFFRK